MAYGLVALASVGAVAACGDDDDDTASEVQEANTEFCQDLNAFGDAVAALADLDPAVATKGDYDEAVDRVKSARSDLSESGEDLREAEQENLEAQAEDLEGALEDAPDDAVVADILASVQSQVDEVRASAATLNTAVCTPENATTTTEA